MKRISRIEVILEPQTYTFPNMSGGAYTHKLCVNVDVNGCDVHTEEWFDFGHFQSAFHYLMEKAERMIEAEIEKLQDEA